MQQHKVTSAKGLFQSKEPAKPWRSAKRVETVTRETTSASFNTETSTCTTPERATRINWKPQSASKRNAVILAVRSSCRCSG
eukprot:4077174-Amphidinium_carterae.2